MRVKIDPEKCEGHAVCTSLVPEVFQIPEGAAVVAVDQLPPSLEPTVQRAVMGCPEQAITVEGVAIPLPVDHPHVDREGDCGWGAWASSETSHRMALEMSIASTISTGDPLAVAAMPGSCSKSFAKSSSTVIGVLTPVGATELTRMLWGAR